MGIPDVIRSDNGPHFIGQAYRNFTTHWGIDHKTSSPRYPRSNGFIERQIKTVKGIIKKARDANENEMLALLRWRTTPIDSTIQSPAEIMFQRKVKDTLPSKATNSIPNADEIKERMLSKQNIQKIYHDQKARLLPTLYPGMVATHRDVQTGKWSPATVLHKAHAPRSYIVQTSSGQVLRRNRKHIREVPQSSDDSKLVNSPGTRDTRLFRQTSNSQQFTPPMSENPHQEQGTSLAMNITDKPSCEQSLGSPQSADPTQITTRTGRRVITPARYSVE